MLLALATQPVQAQFKIASGVFGSGNTVTTDGHYRLVGTFGQPLTGPSLNTTLALESGFWSQSSIVVTAIEQVDEETMPERFHLAQNYPNPFNPTTQIVFSVPQATPVTLTIFDLLGREVATLIDEAMAVGQYEVTFEAGGLPTGLYLYVIEMNGFRAQKTMLLIR